VQGLRQRDLSLDLPGRRDAEADDDPTGRDDFEALCLAALV
jgi:hypothetical protein